MGHLFLICQYGYELRQLRDKLLTFYNNSDIPITDENLIYSNLEGQKHDINVLQLIITLSNYSIYKLKMRKFYNQECFTNRSSLKLSFLLSTKNRIICDHKKLTMRNFIDTWA